MVSDEGASTVFASTLPSRDTLRRPGRAASDRGERLAAGDAATDRRAVRGLERPLAHFADLRDRPAVRRRRPGRRRVAAFGAIAFELGEVMRAPAAGAAKAGVSAASGLRRVEDSTASAADEIELIAGHENAPKTDGENKYRRRQRHARSRADRRAIAAGSRPMRELAQRATQKPRSVAAISGGASAIFGRLISLISFD